MGLDGGTIPTRGELVRMKEKPEQKDRTSDRLHKWNNCTITQLPLELPILTCHLGMLYNKQSILELLLGKSPMRDSPAFIHIESLRDIRELNLTKNPSTSEKSASFICPITGLEMNGKHKFFCNWNCTCVLSERAIQHVKSTACLSCGVSYDLRDLVVLNPNEKDLSLQKEQMVYRKSKKYPSYNPDILLPKNSSSTSSVNTEKICDKPNEASSSDRKRALPDETDSKGHKHKKHKKEKKNKKDKHKQKKSHKKTDSGDTKPKLHPGWTKYLSSL